MRPIALNVPSSQHGLDDVGGARIFGDQRFFSVVINDKGVVIASKNSSINRYITLFGRSYLASFKTLKPLNKGVPVEILSHD